MSNYAITTDNLTKIYGGKRVVDGVNMHVPAGSVYGFVGENGSGKTTIMRLLMGLASPKKGTYTIFDVLNKDKRIYDVRKHISAIVEAPSLVPSMTAKQNLTYACQYYGMKDLSIVDKVLEQVGLSNTGNKKAKNFSLGMRQRLGIAVLLLIKPMMMFLDEPMNGLDPEGIASLRELIINLNKEGITFLISSHILSELEKVATYYGFISHGKLLEEISAEDLFNKCQNGIDLHYEDVSKLTNALDKLNLQYVILQNNMVRVTDKIKPLDLLNQLHQKDIEINKIKTVEGNVEEYYLNLIKEAQHD